MSADRNVASGQLGPQVQVHQYEGTEGHRDNIMRSEIGLMPTAALAKLHGTRGEEPGEHEHYQGAKWDEFEDRITQGIEHPVFVTVDWGEEPKMSEGSNRALPPWNLATPTFRRRSATSVTPNGRERSSSATCTIWSLASECQSQSGNGSVSWLHGTSRGIAPGGGFVEDWEPGE